jgi:hypothetical protein
VVGFVAQHQGEKQAEDATADRRIRGLFDRLVSMPLENSPKVTGEKSLIGGVGDQPAR